jgi:hypothetical protein
VAQDNLIRNLVAQRPARTDPNDGSASEADTPRGGECAAFTAGAGRYLRDVAIVRKRAAFLLGASYSKENLLPSFAALQAGA